MEDLPLTKDLWFNHILPFVGTCMGHFVFVAGVCHQMKAKYTNAAISGHLEILKCAHEKGCPWDECTWFNAAQRGHVEVLKCLKQRVCPQTEST
jgi:hypothetical protein